MGRSFLTKGRAKRKPLPVGHNSTRRVQKEKLPSRFISNAERGDSTDKKRARLFAARKITADGESASEDEPAVVRAAGADDANTADPDGNRQQRREQQKYDEWMIEQGHTPEYCAQYFKGKAAERRLNSEERDLLADEAADRHGGWLKYNFLRTHPSWQASKERRRREQRALEEYGINIAKDALRESFDDSDDNVDTEMGTAGQDHTQGEGDDAEEQEEDEEEEEEEDDIPVVYPSYQPRRRRIVIVDPTAAAAAKPRRTVAVV